jgi:hypothetical protein
MAKIMSSTNEMGKAMFENEPQDSSDSMPKEKSSANEDNVAGSIPVAKTDTIIEHIISERWMKPGKSIGHVIHSDFVPNTRSFDGIIVHSSVGPLVLARIIDVDNLTTGMRHMRIEYVKESELRTTD